MRFLACTATLLAFLFSGTSANARQFTCTTNEEAASVTMRFDSAKPLFDVKVAFPDGKHSEETLLSATEACHTETAGLSCQSVERERDGQYSYSFFCGSTIEMNVYLNEDGAGQITCNSAADPSDIRVFFDCR